MNLSEYSEPKDFVFILSARLHRYSMLLQGYLEKQFNSIQHEAPIDPFELIYIDPNTVTQRDVSGSKLRQTKNHCRLTSVINGDWEDQTKSFHDYDLVEGIHARYSENTAWEDTEFYQNRIDSFRDPTYEKWGCKNVEDFKSRLENLDQLFNSIKLNGYKTQRKLIQEHADDPIYSGYRSLPPEMYEITVHIDRDGTPIFHEGRHRLAMAQVLNLEQVPVRVQARHVEWQQRRDHYANEGISGEHPDLPN